MGANTFLFDAEERPEKVRGADGQTLRSHAKNIYNDDKFRSAMEFGNRPAYMFTKAQTKDHRAEHD